MFVKHKDNIKIHTLWQCEGIFFTSSLNRRMIVITSYKNA